MLRSNNLANGYCVHTGYSHSASLTTDDLYNVIHAVHNISIIIWYSFTGHFRVRLRTSDSGRYPGFSAYVVCFTEKPTGPSKIAPKGTYQSVCPRECLTYWNISQLLWLEKSYAKSTLCKSFLWFICIGTCTHVRKEDVSWQCDGSYEVN